MSLMVLLLGAPVLAATITVDPAGGADHTSLASAISAATSGDTLSLAAGTYTGAFDTAGKDLTIAGDGIANTILTAGAAQTVLTVDDGETVSLSDLTLYSALQGMEVRTSTVSMLRVHVTDHSGRSPGSGVGVYDGGVLTATGSVFARNEASGSYSGGGIYASDSTITVENCTFLNNAAGQGGALYIDNAVATLTDVTLEGNIASTHGGGIRVRYDADLRATRLTVTDNTAGSRGGGLSGYQADVHITDGDFRNNQAGSIGGGLHFDQTSSAIASFSGVVSENTATTTGGGIHADTITLEFTGTLSDNEASDDNEGGGLYALASDVFLDASEISNNSAGTGGGIYSFYGGSLTLDGVTLDGNSAALEGGGLYSENPVNVTDSIVSNNIAAGNGGGVAALYTTLTASNTDFQTNASGEAGGGVYLNDSDATFEGSVSVIGCTAVLGAGIAVAGTGTETIDFDGGQLIAENAASGEGGGIFLSNLGGANLDGLQLLDNAGGVAGGGARLADLAVVSALDLNVQGNRAEQGAGLHLSGMGSGETAYSRFADNIAANAGGGILVQNPAASHPLHHLQFIENAAPEGAGIYLANDVDTLHPLLHSDFAAHAGPAVSLRQSPGALISHVSATQNTAEAFEADTASAGSAIFTWNNSWDNGADFGGALPNLLGLDGNIAADPDYAGVTRDGNSSNDLLIPGSNSGLRDMGDPGARDLDGSIADIGHLGGPDARDQDHDEDGVPISLGDCDDASSSTFPGASETWYDGEDNDCLGGDDYDADGDGFTLGADCDDENPAINPDADDLTVDGVDQDCDENDGPPGSEDGTGTDEGGEDLDLDGDGIAESADCDDSDATAFPGNVESCGDGVDNDCDGFVDDYDNDCTGKASDRACSTTNASPSWPFALLAMALSACRRRNTPKPRPPAALHPPK